jgi:hypothetical protein
MQHGTVEKGFEPPEDKIGKITQILREQPQGAGRRPEGKGKEGYKPGKILPP